MDYPHPSLTRAARAIACSPFELALLTAMVTRGVAPSEIASSLGVALGYTRRSLTESGADQALLWLVDVGVLRREVDGQGLTDSFRLTPLGRQVIERWQHLGQPLPRPSLGDRLQNLGSQWLRWLF